MNAIYPLVLWIHNLVRWVVVIMGALALIRAYRGWLGKRGWDRLDRMAGVFFTSALDLQLLLGLILYFFLSPITRAAFQDLSGVMGNPQARFFVLEHVFYMVVAVILAHVGSSLARKANEATDRHRRAALWYSLSIVALLIGMPWTRPLLPGF